MEALEKVKLGKDLSLGHLVEEFVNARKRLTVRLGDFVEGTEGNGNGNHAETTVLFFFKHTEAPKGLV